MSQRKDADDLWRMLQEADCDVRKSLLKRHLTRERFDQLKTRTTAAGGNLALCIYAGCQEPTYGMGIYASDPDAYDVFEGIFNPIITDYHQVPQCEHPASDFGNITDRRFDSIDPEGEFIVSTRVRVARSHAGFPFTSLVTEQDVRAMEKLSKQALSELPEGLAGTYYPLSSLDTSTKTSLIKDHYLFPLDDSYFRLKGGYKLGETGRGIFFNPDKTFIVWVNEEDHLRLISLQQGADMNSVYERLVTAIAAFDKKLEFAKKSGLGYLTSCPSNLGTTLRASVHIRLSRLSKQADFQNICDNLKLQIRGTYGVATEALDSVFDISNRRRLGITEFEAVREMWTGVATLLEMERNLKQQEADSKQSSTQMPPNPFAD